jgi:hypothetical protein
MSAAKVVMAHRDAGLQLDVAGDDLVLQPTPLQSTPSIAGGGRSGPLRVSFRVMRLERGCRSAHVDGGQNPRVSGDGAQRPPWAVEQSDGP